MTLVFSLSVVGDLFFGLVDMNFGSWNVRSFGKSSKRRMVKDGILFDGLDMVGLQESKHANPVPRTLLSIGGVE